ncbi:MAG: F0F1 ATP synthase subunit gamma [Hyphomicrobiales bacterium]|nr:F0F1 ATP synthase subunit gamma [Hyphomicrobiales bacterium]MBV8439098.1 F0F1 ATP synthase subunit gamma [Hyphomicrobiales bacterium]
MSGKLSEVEGRIGTVHQLEAVITAMRGSAAARSLEARGKLPAVEAYARVIADAIGEALSLDTGDEDDEIDEAAPRGGRSPTLDILIVLGAEQGFAGVFNERVLDAAERHLKSQLAELFVVGARCTMVAAERGLAFGWSAPMAAHADEAPGLASKITDALYDRLEKGGARRVSVIHAAPAPSASIDVVERTLLPFDFARFKAAPRPFPPLTTLPSDELLAELAEEYVFAELCEEVMLSFAAENEARMRAMIAARSNVARKLDELVGSYRRLRQDEITGEIIELSAGAASAERPVKRHRALGGVTSGP